MHKLGIKRVPTYRARFSHPGLRSRAGGEMHVGSCTGVLQVIINGVYPTLQLAALHTQINIYMHAYARGSTGPELDHVTL